MARITSIIHDYLRHNKKFPHVYCPGCGHGIVLGALIRCVHTLGLSKDDIALVAGIGCSGRMAVYVDFNTVHALHGRVMPLATGIKMANPKMKVIAVMGDGDALSIGGNHIIHSARRNIEVTALILNNNIYGMTGGQASPTTPTGAFSATTPYGCLEQQFDIVELFKACGASYVSRGTVFHIKMLDRLLSEAIMHPGFSIVEIMTPCHTQYGRKNKFKTAVDMLKHYKKTALPIENWQKLPPDEQKDRIPIGVFAKQDRPGLSTRYEELRQKLAKP